jgi:2-methylisocitrate lyase-like PEP mutase family enzyme
MTTQTFRNLHAGPNLLVLANCWDAGSARAFESVGAPALATTSAGVAWANGYPDGDALPVEVLVATVRAITRVVKIPVSVDSEGGYSSDPGKAADNVARLIDAGIVGINIEDGTAGADLLATKIERIKGVASRAGTDLFINARTDVYLRELVPEAERITETLARAERYRSAGADGIFVPKARTPDEIRSIAAGVRLPLNVMAWPGLPPAEALFELGARRLSAGAGIARLALAHAVAAASAFVSEGRSECLFDGVPKLGNMNALFGR